MDASMWEDLDSHRRNGQATGHPSGEGTAHTAPPSVPTEAEKAELDAITHRLLASLRAEQPDEKPWALQDIELEQLVPRLARRVERLETEVRNLESVLSMCVEVATRAAERKPLCACCQQLDDIAEAAL